MDSIRLIVGLLAIVSPFLFVILLYYRAWLKSKLDKLNQPQSEQEFIIFKPVKMLNYITEEPRINQSIKSTPLYRRYDVTETVMKYAFFSSIIFNFARGLIIHFAKG